VRRHDRSAAVGADKRILALALEHHLVSRLTSLVAVETTPSRPAGAQLVRAELPLNLPAGWDFDKVFGGERKHNEKRPAVIDTPTLQPADERQAAGGADRVVALRSAPAYYAAPSLAHSSGRMSALAEPPVPAKPSTGRTVRGAADADTESRAVATLPVTPHQPPAALPAPSQGAAVPGTPLPKTTAGAELKLVAGLVLLGVSLAFVVVGVSHLTVM
jgi:hypothetical protein